MHNARSRAAGAAMAVAVAVVAMSAATASAGVRALADQERTPGSPVYTVSLSSDANGFSWTGTESVEFTNTSSGVSLSRIWLRLWDNGIQGCQPTLPIQVSNVTGGTAGSLSVDCTALPVDLSTPLPPGGTATIGFDLAILVPNRNDRFGRIGSEVLVGNALPVLAIQDDLGVHLDPYTAFGESFYSQIGDFTVTLDAPQSLALPASGVTSGQVVKGDRVATTITAEQVRDFAWAAGPLQELDGTTAQGVTVRVWRPSSISKAQARAARASGVSSLESHGEKYGQYPYPEVDIVLGTFTAFGGMEYPQFVMAVPSDSVIVHELGHQWFYGLVGDDEYTEPWLDEAFASYVTDVYYGDNGASCASLRFPAPDARISNSMAYWATHIGTYGLVVYGLGSCALHDLSRKLGANAMSQFLHDYAVEHTYGWSTTDTFMVEAQAVASGLPHPIDLTTFWRKWRIGPA